MKTKILKERKQSSAKSFDLWKLLTITHLCLFLEGRSGFIGHKKTTKWWFLTYCAVPIRNIAGILPIS